MRTFYWFLIFAFLCTVHACNSSGGGGGGSGSGEGGEDEPSKSLFEFFTLVFMF